VSILGGGFMDKKYVLFFAGFLFLAASLLVVKYDSLRGYVSSYATGRTEKLLGSKLIAKEQELKIMAIAAEVGVTEPISIRRMNQKALVTYGYHNAFILFPLFLNCIPVPSKPFLFVSEGFLEDLSSEEQRFLIGHEMIHLKERHFKYMPLVSFLLFIALMLLTWFLRITVARTWNAFLFYFIVYLMAVLLPSLGFLRYRRHLERRADCQSLVLLNTYEGGIKLMERWEKEFKLPAVDKYYGLFSDHPAGAERKIYCLNAYAEPKR
jgi:Zn-dependent protease with chaperone function